MTLRVLVAADQPNTRLQLAALAERTLNAEVVSLADGGQALGCLEEANYEFDLLMLDAEMARASGIDVLSAVRSVRSGLPVVLFGETPDQRRRGGELDVDAFVQKPYRVAEVGDLIDALMSVAA